MNVIASEFARATFSLAINSLKFTMRGGMNLRHCNNISVKDVQRLPECLESLWIGPSFANEQAILVAESLPVSLQKLDIDLTKSHGVEEQILRAVFGRLSRLTTLSVRLRGDRGAEAIANALPNSPTLKKLDLRGNRIGDRGTNIILDALRHLPDQRLRYLNLSWCNLSNATAVALASFLEDPKYCHLEHLDLYYNTMMDNEGFQAVVQSLSTNETLKELYMFGMLKMSNASAQCLVDCLQHDNTTLLKCRLASHLDASIVRRLDCLLSLNQAGRRLLRQHHVPTGLWPHVLVRSAHLGRHYHCEMTHYPSSLYYMIRNNAELITELQGES